MILERLIDRLSFRVTSALQSGGAVTVIASESEQAITMWANARAHLDAAWVVADIRADRCSDRQAFASALERAVNSAMRGDRVLGRHWERLSLDELQRAEAFAFTDDIASSPRQISDSVHALAEHGRAHDLRCALVLRGAQAVRSYPGEADRGVMWSLRSAAQDHPELSLVFVGDQSVIDETRTKDAAFYGWGTVVELDPPTNEEMIDLVARELEVVAPGDAWRLAQDLVERAQGSIAVVDALIEQLVEFQRSTEYLDMGAADRWVGLVRSRAVELGHVLRAAASLHSISIDILQAIAHDVSPHAAADRVAQRRGLKRVHADRALRVLRDAGILSRPRHGEWRFVDPLLRDWIKYTPPVVEGFDISDPRLRELR